MKSLCVNTSLLILEADDGIAAEALYLKDMNGGRLRLKFLYKYGSDGGSGHPIFKQIMDLERKQGHCFVSGMVPLQIVALMDNGDIIIIYNNPLMNSSLSWRPLHLWFTKETKVRTQIEKGQLKAEEIELRGYVHEWINGITIEFEGYDSMNDLKVVNACHDNNAQCVCAICGAKPSQVNDLNGDFTPKISLHELCMSILHFTLRLFEHLLKVGAKIKAKVFLYHATGRIKFRCVVNC